MIARLKRWGGWTVIGVALAALWAFLSAAKARGRRQERIKALKAEKAALEAKREAAVIAAGKAEAAVEQAQEAHDATVDEIQSERDSSIGGDGRRTDDLHREWES